MLMTSSGSTMSLLSGWPVVSRTQLILPLKTVSAGAVPGSTVVPSSWPIPAVSFGLNPMGAVAASVPWPVCSPS
jgi:hypothetical protein